MTPVIEPDAAIILPEVFDLISPMESRTSDPVTEYERRPLALLAIENRSAVVGWDRSRADRDLGIQRHFEK
jgi:hypothetical protein